ncbi:hypothetical protein LX32DRAFT_644723 [Colletotrichum zoysiae]|uniref:Uncharacterized protein n=1 Tax=Colletotrichum zoysiae TaxID=1216348 RepID=A0AAD9H6V3_9PEZI|nr:hypothetical protein LX32DRAFT_644723 [Colletotrichum zoysiae]
MAPALLFLVSSDFRSELETAPASAVRCVALRCVAEGKEEKKKRKASEQNKSAHLPSLLLPFFPPSLLGGLPSHSGYLPLTCRP